VIETPKGESEIPPVNSDGPTAPQRRPGGKALPSRERVAIRKNKVERTRDNGWTRRWLEGREEELEDADTESIAGRGDLFRTRVFVSPQQKAAARTDLLAGVVSRVRGLWIMVWDGSRELPCSLRGHLKSFATRDRRPAAVGDRVRYAMSGTTEGVIEVVEPRTTVLERRDSKNANRCHLVAANIEQLVIVASVQQPDLRPRLIDRYLISAAKGKLDPIIVLNKIDLDSGNERRAWIKLYKGLGYRIVGCSAATREGLDELRQSLTGRTSVIAGQSGVGKSSLLNAVQTGLNLRVGQVCAETEKGRHTTSEAVLLPLNGGGAVIDTPGIRSFALWELQAAELEAYFVEIAPLVAGCRFPNCSHRHEDGCAVTAAVETGRVSPERYDSYLAIYESLESGRGDPRD